MKSAGTPAPSPTRFGSPEDDGVDDAPVQIAPLSVRTVRDAEVAAAAMAAPPTRFPRPLHVMAGSSTLLAVGLAIIAIWRT